MLERKKASMVLNKAILKEMLSLFIIWTLPKALPFCIKRIYIKYG